VVWVRGQQITNLLWVNYPGIPTHILVFGSTNTFSGKIWNTAYRIQYMYMHNMHNMHNIHTDYVYIYIHHLDQDCSSMTSSSTHCCSWCACWLLWSSSRGQKTFLDWKTQKAQQCTVNSSLHGDKLIVVDWTIVKLDLPCETQNSWPLKCLLVGSQYLLLIFAIPGAILASLVVSCNQTLFRQDVHVSNAQRVRRGCMSTVDGYTSRLIWDCYEHPWNLWGNAFDTGL